MSTVGLTKAENRDLTMFKRGRPGLVPQRRVNALIASGFLDVNEVITPRGHAALAAPRMTQAEYDWLSDEERLCGSRAYGSCLRKAWVNVFGRYTPAGRTALNNVRAAMGSQDWKEVG